MEHSSASGSEAENEFVKMFSGGGGYARHTRGKGMRFIPSFRRSLIKIR
jgi:hypothetical protein